MIDFPEFFEKAPLAILIAIEGTVKACNPAFFDVFKGLSKDKVINKPLADLIRVPAKMEHSIARKEKNKNASRAVEAEKFRTVFNGSGIQAQVEVSYMVREAKVNGSSMEEYFIITPVDLPAGAFPVAMEKEVDKHNHSTSVHLENSSEAANAITLIKNTEDALQKSQEKLMEAMRLAKLAFWEFDVKKETLKLSREFGGFVGEAWDDSREISLKKYIQEYVHPSDKKKVRNLLNIAEFTHYIQVENMSEYRLRLKDGLTINLLNILRVKFDGRHIPIGCEGVVQDITLLRKAEAQLHNYHKNLKKLIAQRTKELKQSEEKLSDALKLGKLTTWEFDFAKKKFYGGGEIYDILGPINNREPKNEMDAIDFQKLVHPDDLPIYFDSFERALRTHDENYLDYIEYRIIRADGQVRFLYLSVKVEIGENGRHIRHYGTIQDITAIRKAEEDKERLKATIEITPDIVAIVAPNGSLIYLNQSGRFFYGLLAHEDITNINFFDIQKAETKALLKNTGFLVASTEGIWTGESELEGRNNQMVPVSMAIVAHFGQDGVVNSYSTIIRNISEQKRTEQDLIYKNTELDTFVYRASHDLRGPISSLLGLYQIVQYEIKDEKALGFFDMFNKQILRLNEIILALINLTKIKDSITSQVPINFVDIVNDVIESLRHLADTSNVKFEVKVEVEKEFKSDKSLMITIIQNLIENAIKYSRAKAFPFAKVYIESTPYNTLVIKVEDNGLGMSKEVQSRVFDMFFRGHDVSKGSGLGLYILKNAVEKLKGKITLESEESVGTTFTIELPYFE